MRKRSTTPCKYVGCQDWAWAQGYCSSHYHKLRRTGSIKKQRVMKDDPARFHEKYKINEKTGCWEWTGSIHPSGYGNFGITVNGKAICCRAHRYSYETFVGPLAHGMMACHRCDVRKCVNPKHIFAGSGKANIQDCLKKGRHSSQKGERGVWLSPGMVRNIRVMYARGLACANGNRRNWSSIRDIASVYGVGDETIRKIVKGLSRLDSR